MTTEKDDPGFKKTRKVWSKITPPKRKVKLFLDRNIPEELKEAVKASRVFKVTGFAGENDSDEFIWNTAKRLNAIILSLDKGDFWNDKKFPLRESPGVILIASREQSVDVHIYALNRFFTQMDIVGVIRMGSDLLKQSKYKVSIGGFNHKYITREGSAEVVNIEYD